MSCLAMRALRHGLLGMIGRLGSVATSVEKVRLRAGDATGWRGNATSRDEKLLPLTAIMASTSSKVIGN